MQFSLDSWWRVAEHRIVNHVKKPDQLHNPTFQWSGDTVEERGVSHPHSNFDFLNLLVDVKFLH